LLQLIGCEAASLIIRNFETLLVPCLLQTEDYARAINQQFEERTPAKQVNALVEFQMRRQEQLDRDNPPLLFFILDEAVVRRLIGGKDVMRRQIRHLIEMTAKPNVTIEIVPFNAGTHPGLKGSFVIVEFPGQEDDDVVFLEAPFGELVSKDDPQKVLTCREFFEQLRQLSLGPSNSVDYLDNVVREIIA
jgi:Domain of unknown function (DUF5753)